MRLTSFVFCVAAICLQATSLLAQAVIHNPSSGLPTMDLSPANPFNGAAAQRWPVVAREDAPVRVYLQVCCQFTYDRVSVYFTTDGSEPNGAAGNGQGSTQVLNSSAGQVSFVANHFNQPGGTRDWWVATFPPATRGYQQTVKYKVSKWSAGNPAGEVFNDGTAPSSAAPFYQYTNKLAWPGAGSGTPNPEAGYPQLHFWKEEAITGNGYINLQVDQNGNHYDIYFPGAGGVYGVSTKNEGYVDGVDTFPPGLPLDNRGQMHINLAQAGIRVGGTTYWLSNRNGTDFASVQQAYASDTTNTVATSQRLVGGGHDILVTQSDFAPRGITFPTDSGGNPLRSVLIKRMVLRNQGLAPVTANVYWFCDAALNGGDAYDASFMLANGAMVHYDNTYRVATNTGPIGPGQEYNPTTTGGYEKNVSVYLCNVLKVGGSVATNSWRDSSSDNGIGWVGGQVHLPPGVDVTVEVLTAGGFDNFAGATGTYAAQIAPVVNWFASNDMSAAQTATDASWATWLNSGVTVDTPDDEMDRLFKRGLLATALHIDARSGSMIAGFHNGAYPYVWPRDAAYGAVTLARTGHLQESEAVFNWMKNTAFRDFEGWGRKGFWKQKYTTDGYVVWNAPQIDETAVFPWGVYYQYKVTGDPAVLTRYLEQLRDAVLTCSQTSTVDPARLNVSFGLIYSNNVWEDSYDTFVYSNANVVRGLRDAALAFDALGLAAERDDAQNRANSIKAALDARLDWDGENTDISQLGVSYPFEVYSPIDFRAQRVLDRIKGTRTKFNNAHPTPEPLLNTFGDFAGLVNRYWGDSYWNGGPWFLTTLWYGAFHAHRADFTPGKADIDEHLYRLQRTAEFNGPAGLGAEQIAPLGSLLIPGQGDFRLQTAWPNAWESMSTYVDCVMLFAGYTPDGPGNTLRVAPKLPSLWSEITFRNLVVGGNTFDVRAVEAPDQGWNGVQVTTKPSTRPSDPSSFSTRVRLPQGSNACLVMVNSTRVPAAGYTVDPATSSVLVTGVLPDTVGSVTSIRVYTRSPADLGVQGGEGGSDGLLNNNDFIAFIDAFFAQAPRADMGSQGGVFGSDGLFNNNDFVVFIDLFFAGCAG